MNKYKINRMTNLKEYKIYNKNIYIIYIFYAFCSKTTNNNFLKPL